MQTNGANFGSRILKCIQMQQKLGLVQYEETSTDGLG